MQINARQAEHDIQALQQWQNGGAHLQYAAMAALQAPLLRVAFTASIL